MKLLDKQTELAAHLKMYASGSGVLSFTFCSYHTKTQGQALSAAVTEDDIKEYMNLKQGLYNDHRIIKDNNGEFCLMLDIKRVSENVLSVPYVDERLNFTYELSSGGYSFGFRLTDDEGLEVLHISTKSAIKYFLENEDRLK